MLLQKQKLEITKFNRNNAGMSNVNYFKIVIIICLGFL